jgi:hypothetical protein
MLKATSLRKNFHLAFSPLIYVSLLSGILLSGCSEHKDSEELSANYNGKEIVASRCTSCHSLEPDVRKIGPSLHGLLGREVKLSSGKVFPRDKDYIKRSITDADAEIVEGYFAGTCPDAGYNTKMKLQRVEAVVEFLTGPETGNKPSHAREPEK